MTKNQQKHRFGKSLFIQEMGLEYRHCGSLHAADAELVLQAARDVYTCRGEGQSI